MQNHLRTQQQNCTKNICYHLQTLKNKASLLTALVDQIRRHILLEQLKTLQQNFAKSLLHQLQTQRGKQLFFITLVSQAIAFSGIIGHHILQERPQQQNPATIPLNPFTTGYFLKPKKSHQPWQKSMRLLKKISTHIQPNKLTLEKYQWTQTNSQIQLAYNSHNSLDQMLPLFQTPTQNCEIKHFSQSPPHPTVLALTCQTLSI